MINCISRTVGPEMNTLTYTTSTHTNKINDDDGVTNPSTLFSYSHVKTMKGFISVRFRDKFMRLRGKHCF